MESYRVLYTRRSTQHGLQFTHIHTKAFSKSSYSITTSHSSNAMEIQQTSNWCMEWGGYIWECNGREPTILYSSIDGWIEQNEIKPVCSFYYILFAVRWWYVCENFLRCIINFKIEYLNLTLKDNTMFRLFSINEWFDFPVIGIQCGKIRRNCY